MGAPAHRFRTRLVLETVESGGGEGGGVSILWESVFDV